MPFCNACGSTMETGARFCPKCGAAAVASPAAAVSTPGSAGAPSPAAPPAPAKSSSALKIILIIVAIIFAIGILGVGTVGFIAWRIAHHTHVVNKNGEVKIESPFGTIESTEDANQAARSVGVDLYPGATVAKGSAANLTIGGMHTAAVDLETDDLPSTVNDFYKSRFSKANVMSSEGGGYTIIAGDKGNMTTITIEPREGRTRIHIAKITGKAIGSASSN
jgi:hypothetical protein